MLLNVNAQTTKEKFNFSVFPKVEKDFKRVVIQVPATINDASRQIEIFVGKQEMVDCNRHTLMGEIAEKELEGFGYNYYIVHSKGEFTSTLMACPDNKKIKKFITFVPRIMRYNSKMPIVFYIPNGFEVRYRILTASKTMHTATIK
ncbi:MAG: hypothetical protein AMXMBFR79_09040 [Chitinophagaceae bacterium]|nr:ecotin [Chitinophagales bacterium]